MNYVKVKDSQNLVRDLSTNAIINTDKNEYLKYIEEKNRKENDQNKIMNIENELNQLKNDIDEIKTLLRNLSK